MVDMVQRSFSGGELSPSLYVRTDQTKFMNGCRTALNFYVKKAGGLANRPGLRYITEVDFFSPPNPVNPNIRLMRFVFNDAQTYILIHVEGLFRIIKNGALVRVTGVVPWTNPSTWDAGDVVSYLGVNYVALGDIIAPNDVVPPPSNAASWHALTDDILELRTGYFSDALPYLKYQQSADIIVAVLAHDPYIYSPKKIARLADDRWFVQTAIVFPQITAPTLTASGTGGSKSFTYIATSVAENTYEEGLPSGLTTTLVSAADPTPAAPITITITNHPIAGVAEYNIYKAINGKYAYIGTSAASTFLDEGQTPDLSASPPEVLPFLGFNDYQPGVVGFIQQRLAFAASVPEPERVWMSRIGLYFNFTGSQPLQDDDAIAFNLAGKRISRVQALLEIGGPIMFTEGGEYLIQGDAGGAITPFSINPKAISLNGCSSTVEPVAVDDSAIYVQNRGSIVRDLRFNMQDTGYEGRDLTVYSSHLFKNKRVVAMDYSQNPDSLVWVVLDDGTFLSLSYLREHQIWGWTRHQTDGFVMDVAVIPEGDRDAPYFTIRRTIEGNNRYYIERLEPREDVDVDQFFYVDSGLSYDGTNTTATTMTMVGQGSMTVNDWFTLQSSAAFFTAGDVGNAIVMRQGEHELTLKIMEYVSTTQVKVEPTRDLTGPEYDQIFFSIIDVAITTWAKAVDVFSGLGHLEGKAVAVLADGGVVTNGFEAPILTVTAGSVAIPRPAVNVHIGLPYKSDFESLDVDIRDQPMRQRAKMMTHVGVMVEATTAAKAGSSFDRMVEYKIRKDSDGIDGPVPPKTGYFDVSVESGWDEEIRVCVRQDNPLPITVSGLIPRYIVGG